MKLVICNNRKSVNRLDGTHTGKKGKLSMSVTELGLENFEKDLITTVVRKSEEPTKMELTIDLEKAGTKHLPKGSERFSYEPTSEYGVIYIPVNRLDRVYQTEKATNKDKVAELVSCMGKGKALPPVEIGYNYDVQDGHHRWDASIKAGYTHVPCKVVGDNAKKITKAKKKYRQLWKSAEVDLVKGLESRLRDLVLFNLTDEDEAIQAYAEIVGLLQDGKVKDVILEIMNDELDHYHNLSQVLRLLDGDGTALDDDKLLKGLALVVDLSKSGDGDTGPSDGKLDKSKLIQVSIAVNGKNGTFQRLQWVKRGEIPKGAVPVKGKSSYNHSKKGISEMEKRQSNKFPISHYPTAELKNTIFNYKVDKVAYNNALNDYYEGNELPYVKVSPNGDILDNHHLVDLATNLGLSHIPTIVIGNPRMKKQLEDRLKDDVIYEDEGGNKELLTKKNSRKQTTELSEEVMGAVEDFINLTKKKYPRQYLMDQAKEKGIGWSSKTKDGKELPAESNILWMRAHQAIVSHLERGGEFNVKDNKKQVGERMDDRGKDGIEPHWLKVMEKFKYNKDEILEYARTTGIHWKEQKDTDMNWMFGSMAIKNHMRGGKMFAGIRSRQKELIKEQELVVTDQMKKHVSDLRHRHGKMDVMDRAELLGIVWDQDDKHGMPLAPESRVRWMRAHVAISRYIALGNEFNMTDNVDDKLASVITASQTGLTKNQLFAMDVARRNTKAVEKESKDWALKVFDVDRNITGDDAEVMYDIFMENARQAKVMVQFNPFEKLTNGVNLIDQLISDGAFKNDYEYNRGYSYDHKGSNENDMFSYDYSDTPDSERPVYGIIDVYNRGIGASTLGSVSIVLNDDIKKRATGSHLDADNIPYGMEGTTVRSMEDPHHLIMDRWRNKWKNPNKPDKQRIRAMDAVLNGETHTDDREYFETHIHGGVDLHKDVSHILVPNSWQADTSFTKQLNKVKELANLVGTSIKYE